MFRHRDDDAGADEAANAQSEPLAPDERASLLKSGKAYVGLISQATPTPQQDNSTIWHLVMSYNDGKKTHQVQFVDGLPNRFQFAQGSHLPIRVGQSTVIVDDVHLDNRAGQESSLHIGPGQVVRLEDLPRMVIGGPQPKSWKLPDHCPNCGAPVDQAMESAQTDPRCVFCEQPLPVQ